MRESIFHLLVHFPNACNSRDWTRLKPGARNSFLFFHVGDEEPSTWTITAAPYGAH